MRNHARKATTTLLDIALRKIGPGYGAIYAKRFSSSISAEPEILYTSLKQIPSHEIDTFAQNLSKRINAKKRLRIDNKVYQISSDDIEVSSEDKSGQMLVTSKDDFEIKYGKSGIAPSAITTPHGLLTKSIKIPKDEFGVVDITNHTPFSIVAEDPNKVLAIKVCDLQEVLEHEENIKKYSLTKVIDLPLETAKIISIRLQQAILENKKNEYFYKEITSKLYSPSKYNRSSGTLMSFDPDVESDSPESTSSHYHPGERSLYIVTTNKSAGVTLNFCGIHENPEDRPDCKVYVPFPKNSLIVVNFPPNTHHMFDGEFVCISIHPREGENLIEALESGILPAGFLESATIFSKTHGEQEGEWKSSKPFNKENLSQKERHISK